MRLFTDSGCDLPKEFYIEQDVTLLPMQVHLEKGIFSDVVEIDPREVYQAIEQGEHPKTSQIPIAVLEDAYRQLAKADEEGIYLAFSSGLSGTYQTAEMIKDQVAESYPGLKLEIIDTKCASLGQGLLVKRAVELRDAGKSFPETVAELKKAAAHMEHIFTVKDLDYLAKGGRLSKAGAFLGGLLSINPILNVEDGKLIPFHKVRGHKKALKKMLEVAKERGGSTLSQQVIGISHSDDLETALVLKQMAEEILQPKEIVIEMIGSAIGAHCGQGTVAVFLLNQSYFD